MSDRFLITGALGCIGAWATRLLLDEGAAVISFDLGSDRRRLEALLSPDELARVRFVAGDVTDLAALERAMGEDGTTHVIHLAALLVPLVAADPPRGALVNVVGTTNVLEAARRRGVHGVSYASSAAVYGPADGRGGADARAPATLYGVFKLANEGTARVYWHEFGLPSVGLRPYVVYGPGRDAGLTAGPTLAIAAAARGEPYHIAFGGRSQLQYAPDVARLFIVAARRGYEGAPAFNVGGPAEAVADVIAAIEAVLPDAAGTITYDDVPLPFPPELDAGDLEAVVGPVARTPLVEGVRETVEFFRR